MLQTVCVCTVLLSVTFGRIIDLSHDHGPNTLMSPHAPSYNRSNWFAGEYVPGIYVESGQYFSGEHGGTHMDAPLHFMKGGQPLDQIPIENTILEGVMIDCAEDVGKEKEEYSVPLQKILDWEKINGPVPYGAAVIFSFGWSSRFSNPSLYLATDNLDDQFTYKFPSIGMEAADYLIDKRGMKIIGSDALSPDPLVARPGEQTFHIHVRMLKQNRLIIENVRDPSRLPATGFRFHCAPVKYVGATGSQIRAYAITYDKKECLNSAPKYYQSCYFFIVSFLFFFLIF